MSFCDNDVTFSRNLSHVIGTDCVLFYNVNKKLYCTLLIKPSTLQFCSDKPIVNLTDSYDNTVRGESQTRMYNNVTLLVIMT